MTAQADYQAIFAELRGVQLGAVTFVQDYLQLHFDGPVINVTSPLTVITSSGTRTAWQPGFRDLLCGQIAKLVQAVEHRAGEALILRFDDGSSLSITLRPEDYLSTEAYYAHGFASETWQVE